MLAMATPALREDVPGRATDMWGDDCCWGIVFITNSKLRNTHGLMVDSMFSEVGHTASSLLHCYLDSALR